jgi:anti-anti-sigma regulatory factor
MLYDITMDITIEEHSDVIWMILAGAFRKEQIPNMKEKFVILLDDGNRHFVIDLDKITAIDDQVVQMFLHILNMIKGKGGEIKLIFKNEIVQKAFASYNNLFPVYPDRAALNSGSFLNSLKLRGKFLSRKTGIRISRPVAIFLLIVLCGWFITLTFIIHLQSSYLNKQKSDLHTLQQSNQQSKIELEGLRERIKPLEQLGILKDSSGVRLK